jgi:prepilin-type processing-associated H-X9-DG protein
MFCTRCGRELPVGARSCSSCGAAAAASPAVPYASGPPPAPSETCPMATASLVLGILGLCTMGVAAIAGLVLGVAAVFRISRSRGRLGGMGLAVGGLVVSALMLLVVVPVGASVLMPAIGKSRERARRSECLSNLKQIDLAMLMYTSDYDDQWPPADRWCDLTEPYVKTPSIYVCPELADVTCSYDYNDEPVRNMPPEAAPYLADAAVLFDGTIGTWNATGGQADVDARHDNGANIAFADGHAKWMGASHFGEARWGPYSEETLKRIRSGSGAARTDELEKHYQFEPLDAPGGAERRPMPTPAVPPPATLLPTVPRPLAPTPAVPPPSALRVGAGEGASPQWEREPAVAEEPAGVSKS